MKEVLINFAPTSAAEVSTLYRLIYRSEESITAEHSASEELQRLKATSAYRNALNGVTGALLYRPGRFLQILEGPRQQLELTFERICRDRRHRKLALLEFAAVDHRRFGQWAMELTAHDPVSGADVINLALDGIAGEGGSEALLDAVSAAFDRQAATDLTPASSI